MGSSVALLAGLIMTLLVFVLLPEFQERLQGEFAPLIEAIAWAVLLTATSTTSFLGQLKLRPWRVAAQLALIGAVVAVGWRYWSA